MAADSNRSDSDEMYIINFHQDNQITYTNSSGA